MDRSSWKNQKSIIEAALDLPRDARESFIDERCGTDDELRAEIESLLKFADDEYDPIEAAAENLLVNGSLVRPVNPGDIVGKYRIVEEMANGGMGAVFSAERADGEFEQKVAVKFIRSTCFSSEIFSRFLNERRILASLDHPNICRLIDGGQTDRGTPYLIMEYVEGASLTEFAARNKLSLSDRLELFNKICSAVSFAHRNLVVHRDLKPTNILITEDGTPKLLDFGIAKLLTPEFTSGTKTFSPSFTPEYASPEQIRGEKITTSADIYSLGIILYELLTGDRPFDHSNKNLGEIITGVGQTPIERPSTAVENRKKITDSAVNSRLLRGDLDNIVLKALASEPERRYASAEQLSEDIGRYLEGRPVLARKDSFFYRSGKFVKRNPIPIGLLALTITLLTAAVFIINNERRTADIERAKAERRFNEIRALANSFIFEINAKIAESPLEAREELVRTALEYLDKLSSEDESDAELQAEIAAAYEKIGQIQGEIYRPSLGKAGAALESQRRALEIRQRLFDQNPEDIDIGLSLSSSHLRVANLLMVTAEVDKAIEHYREAVSLGEKLLKTAPDNIEAVKNISRGQAMLGQAILRTGDLSEALKNYRQAVSIINTALQRDSKERSTRHLLSIYQTYKAYVLLEMGSADEALKLLESSLSIEREILETDRDNVELRRNYAMALGWKGIGLRDLRRFDESTEALKESLEIFTEIYRSDVSNEGMRNNVADLQHELGKTYLFSSDLKSAEQFLHRSIENYSAIAGVDRENLAVKRQIAYVSLYLLESLIKQGRFAEARQKLTEPGEILNDLVNRDPENAEWKNDLANWNVIAGEIFLKVGDENKAAAHLKRAVPMFDSLTARSPENRRLAGEYSRLKNLLEKI